MGLSENLGKKPNPYGGSSFFQVTKAIWEYSPNIWKSPYIATAITIDNVRSRLELAMSPQWQYRNWNDHGPLRVSPSIGGIQVNPGNLGTTSATGVKVHRDIQAPVHKRMRKSWVSHLHSMCHCK